MERNCSDYLDLKLESLNLINEREIVFLDVKCVFANEEMQGALKGVGVDYRTSGLTEVSKANLGRGKLDDINGLEASFLPVEKQLEYCAQERY